MDFKDARFGQKIKVLSGPYKDRIFMIEQCSNQIIDGVIVADNIAEKYLHFCCDDLELVSDRKY